MRLLHLYWPHLPLDLARSRSASFPNGPIVLGGQPWTDGTVIDANGAARALGVRRGIPLGTAHRLAPEAVFLDTMREADAAAVEAAFEALAGFITAGRGRKLSLERVDGEPVVGSPWEELLIELGFRAGPRKLTLSA